jgi:hypothetical protein
VQQKFLNGIVGGGVRSGAFATGVIAQGIDIKRIKIDMQMKTIDFLNSTMITCLNKTKGNTEKLRSFYFYHVG